MFENVISGSKNLPSILKFARKVFPGHQRVALHRNIPQKRAQHNKNYRVPSKPRYKLELAMKLSPGRQRVELHRNSPQKRAQRVGKPP